MPLTCAGEKILILGAGVTGNSVARALHMRGAVVTLVDENPAAVSEFEIVKVSKIKLSEFNSVVVSPGWRQNHPLIQQALAQGIPLLNEIDLAWHIKNEVAPNQRWIALTGTNGKTTTVEMAAAMVRAGGLHATACGNVGDTVIDALEQSHTFDVLVLELSSFQLHWCKEAQFVASAILNIADDHIDWHGSFDEYAQSKISLLDRSTTAILNGDDSQVVQRTAHWQGRKVFYSLDTPAPGEIGLVEELLVDRAFVADPQEAAMFAELLEVKPTVPHNVSNALAAAALARTVGVSHEDIRKAIQGFRTGRHRIETILESDSITWVDDSKATNPHAAAAALMSHESVIWIAGGLAKGAQMGELVAKTSQRIKAAILIGADRDLIEAAFVQFSPQTKRVMIDPGSEYVKGGDSNSLMENIVMCAIQLADKGDSVLLAPACASMDQFLSYADRGDRFAQAVKKLVAHAN